jgi:hypothetical protein
MPNLLSSPENTIFKGVVPPSIEWQESTDNQESENQKTDIFPEFPEITQIAENIKSKFPKDFDLNTFQEITNKILSSLKKNSLEYISTFIKEDFENIFVDIISKDIEYFKQKSDDFFIPEIKDFIITKEKNKVKEEKRKRL